MKKIAILGSTGSIGTQTLDVAREQGDIELRLAEEKRSKAFENTAYALSDYEKEMTAENIHTEAKALLARREKR